MAGNIQSLSVFVASPGDVADERARLEDVIRELNITWSKHIGIQLDLVQWDTHAFPGFGDDAQDVINAQIADDYDLFIGIMWCRYGTATKRADSGTVEEFRRAKNRFDRDPSSVRLMIYFKDAPIAPSKVDPGQLSKVAEFKSTLGTEGGLYWTFSSLDHFEQLIRMHLARQVQSWTERNRRDSGASTARPEPKSGGAELVPIESEDEGVLDLMEIFEERSVAMTEIASRIVSATNDLNSRISSRTADIYTAKESANGTVSRGTAKRLLASVATDMDHYVARMEVEIPLFGAAVSESMNAFVKAMNMSLDDKAENLSPGDINAAMKSASELQEAIRSTEASMVDFRDVIARIPRLTSVLSKAKRSVALVLDKLIIELQTAHSLTSEATATLLRAAHDSPKN